MAGAGRSPARYQRLPFAREIAEMSAAAAAAYGLPANATMLPVPGSEIAIRRATNDRRWPGWYSGARLRLTCQRVGRAAGADVHEFAELPDPDRRDLKTLIVVNPNNPDGRIVSRADLAAFARAMTSNGGRVIVDEAFADLRPEVSLLALPELPAGTIVLRSL